MDSWIGFAKEAFASSAFDRLAGGAAGAAVAAFWFRGSWTAKLMFAVVSVASSYHGSILLQYLLPGNAGLIGVYGFVSAVFGLTVLGRLLTALSHWNAAPAVQQIIERVFGLHPQKKSDK